jgi:hypothetical protein
MLFENIDYCAIVDLQNAFLGESFSDLPGTEVGMLEFVLYHFALIFWCEPFGMGMVSMGFPGFWSHRHITGLMCIKNPVTMRV